MTGTNNIFNRLCIIGLGLIGSSVARRARRDGLAREVRGADRSRRSCQLAEAMRVVDRAYTDAGQAVAGADLIVLAVPLSGYSPIGQAIGPQLADGAIVTDTGSVKTSPIRELAQHLPDGVHLIPGHPIAGTEHSGVEAGFAELFDGRYCLLTPHPRADQDALNRLIQFWQDCGAIVESMEAEHHDRVLAITSHLPHLIAFTIVGTASTLEEDIRNEVIKYSASGFRDFTRIAASDPVMWRDVFLGNRDAVLDTLQRFTEDLTELQRAIRRGEGESLRNRFAQSRDIRRTVIEYGQAD